MPSITINGTRCDFTPGATILQIANANAIAIPQYCYHDALSIVASCRICLVEVHAPNAKTGALEPFMGGKLVPSCQQTASDGMVVYSNSPKAVQNQKAVMEYLLINHPLDCPVCDQSGECFLQDYSYQYGRGVSRFQETKVKNPKKDLGPHVYLYADRCIMCTRCVRFAREVAGTGELLVMGRGNREEIDVFPGVPLDNPLSANVIDLCPVGALLDKDFLFAQRVWFLKGTPSIDGITASGDNINIEHNEGKIYRIKPRRNHAVNGFWISDEVRYGWKHVHSDQRLSTPLRRQYGAQIESDRVRAYEAAIDGIRDHMALGRTARPDEMRPVLLKGQTRPRRLAILISPMLPCEEAFVLAEMARFLDPGAIVGVGPVPTTGPDQVLPAGAKEGDKGSFVISGEKAPNARGVRRVLAALGGTALGGTGLRTVSGGAAVGGTSGSPLEFDDFVRALSQTSSHSQIAAVILTGNYPSDWVTPDLAAAIKGKFVVLMDTLHTALADAADVVLPTCTWAEKAGTFENRRGLLQAFEAAIPALEGTRSEGQTALDLLAHATGQDRLGGTGLRPVSGGAVAGAAPAGAPGHAPTDVSGHSAVAEPVILAPATAATAAGAAIVEIIDEGPGQVPAAVTVPIPRAPTFNPAAVRQRMATEVGALGVFATEVRMPVVEAEQRPGVEMVEL